jgi:catechol 2,3-dioxygenase
VALRASDVERSAGFYARLVGLEVGRLEANRAVLTAPGAGPVLLELRLAERPGPAPRRATGLFHTAFRYPRRAQLASTLRELAQARTPLSGASDHLVSEALYLDDPDGLGIELYRDRPREEWPPPEPGERVRMDTLPLDLESLAAEPGPDTERAADADVGHVHLKVADIAAAEAFWTGAIGLEVMARYGGEASFLASDGYHHHVGVNTWLSAGAPPEPADRPGVDSVVLAIGDDPGLSAAAAERLESAGAPVDRRDGALATRTPDGVEVLLEAS